MKKRPRLICSVVTANSYEDTAYLDADCCGHDHGTLTANRRPAFLRKKKRKGKKVKAKDKDPSRNLLKVDPSRTFHLRRAFTNQIRKKFSRLKAEIFKLLVLDDAFGLVERKPFQPIPNINSDSFFATCERDEKGWCVGDTKANDLDSPQFKEWFGDSKVADGEGNPLEVYHGSERGGDWNVFDSEMSGENTNAGNTVLGHFFSDDLELVEAMYVGVRGTVHPVFLSIQNPLRLKDPAGGVDNDPGWVLRLEAKDYLGKNPETRDDWLEFKDYLKRQGHDGIIYESHPGSQYNQTTYIAFEPEQIKSSISNRGTYSRTDKNVNNAQVDNRWGIFGGKAKAEPASSGSGGSGDNCGIGAGGFQPGNTCASKGDSKGSSVASTGSDRGPRVVGDPSPNNPRIFTPAFKNWFKSSKVTDHKGDPKETASARLHDDAGKPVVVYHGTAHGEFDEFREDKITHPDELYFGKGFYFTEDVQAAKVFAETQHSGATKPTVMSMYLSIQKPFDADNDKIDPRKLPEKDKATIRSQIMQKVFSSDGRSEAVEAGRSFDSGGYSMTYDEMTKTYGVSKGSIRKVLEEAGHDGITVQSAEAGGEKGKNRFWIAFKPTQIKSTTASKFDPDDPHINNAEWEAILNAWCPTGEGGGRDNSCGPLPKSGDKVKIKTTGGLPLYDEQENMLLSGSEITIERIGPVYRGVTGKRLRDVIGRTDKGIKIKLFDYELANNSFNPDQPRDADGKFGSGDGTPGSEMKANRVLAFAKGLPASVIGRIKDQVKTKYAKLDKRYGPRYAKAIIGAALLGLPVPLPGASFASASVVLAVAEMHRMVSGGPTSNLDEVEPELNKEVIEHAAQQLIDSLTAELSDIEGEEGKALGGSGMNNRVVWDGYTGNLSAADVDRAASEANPEPTEAQKHSANYKMGHVTIQGLPITIETAKGSTRSGKNKQGEEWSVVLKSHYGYVKKTKSEADGDHVDVFIGPDPESETVFVIDQDVDGKFDEHKCMIGWHTEQEAKDAYHASYSKGWNGFKAITKLTMEQFKRWLKEGDTSKPISEQPLTENFNPDQERDENGRWAGGDTAVGRVPNVIYHSFSGSSPRLDSVSGVFGVDSEGASEYGDKYVGLVLDTSAKIFVARDQAEAATKLFDREQAAKLKRAYLNGGRREVHKVDEEIAKKLRQDGYDVIHYRESEQYGEEWAILNPSKITKQIKPTTNQFVINAPDDWRFSSDPEKIKKFREWLKKQIGAYLTGKTDRELWQAYADAGFRKGAGRAFDDTKKPYAKGYAKDESTADFYHGSKEQFLRSSFGRPETAEKVMLLAGRSFDDLEGVTEDMSLRMSRHLTDGLVEGKNPREIAKDLDDDLAIGRGRAEVIARTEIMRAHSEGQLDAFERLGVEEIGAAVEFITAKDEKVCPECAILEGVVLKIEEARNILPLHPNCLPGDSLVLSRTGIAAASKRWYDGDLIIIQTASNRVLSCTPNHPILTDLGWVPARLLDVSSNVVCDGGSEWESVVNNQDQHVPTRIEEVADSLRRSSHVTSSEVPTSAPDFHGDGMDGNVAVIWTDSKLRDKRNTFSPQHPPESVFSLRHINVSKFFSSFGPSYLFVKGMLSSARRLISGCNLLSSLLTSHLRPFQRFSFASASPADTGFGQFLADNPSVNLEPLGHFVFRYPTKVHSNQFLSRNKFSLLRSVFISKDSPDDLVSDSELACKLTAGDAGPVFLDKVVSLIVQKFVGHVYNLETGGGYYSAQGIITHNCRCTWLPANLGEDQDEQKRSKAEIDAAFEDVGMEFEVDEKRPQSIFNQRYQPKNRLAQLSEIENLTDNISFFAECDRNEKGWCMPGSGSTNDPQEVEKLFSRIAQPDGGFTYRPLTHDSPKEGFALSPYPERSFAKDAKDLTPDDIVDFYKKNADILNQNEHFIGGWHDPASDKVFLDVSIVSGDRARAERLCKEKDQIAYFDLKEGKSVTVDANTTSGGVANRRHNERQTPAQTVRHQRDANSRGHTSNVQATHRQRDDPRGSRTHQRETPEARITENVDDDELGWNVFCSTGMGGGVDPTCGKGGGKSEERGSGPRRLLGRDLGYALARPEAGPDAEHVIGRLTHTKELSGNDKTILLHTNDWTPEVNHAWIQAAIDHGRPVRFAHPIKSNDLSREHFNAETGEIERVDTVLKHELRQLAKAGYKPRRDKDGSIIGMHRPVGTTTNTEHDTTWLDDFCNGDY